MNSPETCDYLIIGGGSAGCVVAARLAEARAGRVLVLEADNAAECGALYASISRSAPRPPIRPLPVLRMESQGLFRE